MVIDKHFNFNQRLIHDKARDTEFKWHDAPLLQDTTVERLPSAGSLFNYFRDNKKLKVTLFDIEMEETGVITLVHPDKSDPGCAQFSYLSPIGLQLLDSKIGDIIKVNIFGRVDSFYVLNIEF